MQQIKRVSQVFRILFQLAFVFLFMIEICTWLLAPDSINFLHQFGVNMVPYGYFNHHVIPDLILQTKLLGFLVSMLSTGIQLIILYFLISLFKRFENGDIFSLPNVHYIRNIGYALLVDQVISPIYQTLIGLVLNWHKTVGPRAIIGINTNDVGMILGAFLIILLSWMMAEGCKLREEQQLTI